MKKIVLLALATFATFAAQADILETKFKVTGRYYDELGNTRKLTPTRAFIRYNSEAGLLSQSAKSDCLVMSGKSDIASIWTEADKSECISNKSYVITSEEIIVDMFYRPAIFSLHNDIDNVYDLLVADAVVTGKTDNDAGLTGSLRASIRNFLGNATRMQTISLEETTQFTLKAQGRAKFLIELEPVKTKMLNH